MSQVIMMFLFPIGLYFYFFVERRDRPKYQKIFDDFGESIQNDSTLTHAQKIEKYNAMLRQNGYTIVESSKNKVRAEKRILSMSLLAMSIGAYYVGVFVYLAYHYWVQKPHVVEYEV